MIELVGWVGATCFSFCGLPQALKTYRTKSAQDFSWGFLWMWMIGEVLTFIYVLAQNIELGVYQLPLLINYFLNFSILCYLFFAKVRYDV